eukprot:gene1908-7980_t
MIQQAVAVTVCLGGIERKAGTQGEVEGAEGSTSSADTAQSVVAPTTVRGAAGRGIGKQGSYSPTWLSIYLAALPTYLPMREPTQHNGGTSQTILRSGVWNLQRTPQQGAGGGKGATTTKQKSVQDNYMVWTCLHPHPDRISVNIAHRFLKLQRSCSRELQLAQMQLERRQLVCCQSKLDVAEIVVVALIKVLHVTFGLQNAALRNDTADYFGNAFASALFNNVSVGSFPGLSALC